MTDPQLLLMLAVGTLLLLNGLLARAHGGQRREVESVERGDSPPLV